MRLTIDSTQKHIILLKLVDLYDHVPDFRPGPIKAMTKERLWLSAVGALLKAISIIYEAEYKTAISMLSRYRDFAINNILSQIGDAIEELKLDLELDGRSEIGSAYEPGDVYRFYADLKAIISSVQSEIVVIDPYFNGDAFDAYLSSMPNETSIKILSDRYTDDIGKYVSRHMEQYHSRIEVRQTKELHDRLLIIDNTDCWVVGQSIKDAATKTTYLIPLSPTISEAKIKIYSEIWERANEC